MTLWCLIQCVYIVLNYKRWRATRLCFITVVHPFSTRALGFVFDIFTTWHYKYSIFKYTFFFLFTQSKTLAAVFNCASYGLPGWVNCSCFSTCVKNLGSGHDTLISLPLVPGSESRRASRWRGRWRLLLCSSSSFASTRSGNFCKPVEGKQVASKTLFSWKNSGWMKTGSLKSSIFQPLIDNSISLLTNSIVAFNNRRYPLKIL